MGSFSNEVVIGFKLRMNLRDFRIKEMALVVD